MDPINPHLNQQKAPDDNPEELFRNLLAGNRAALSRALTLVESRLPRHREVAEALLQKALPHSGNSLRIGITGVPGVGKSSFIEVFGMELIKRGHRVAVLAIDPSSSRSRGSILGDKTRMQRLGQCDEAFIRPSPTGGSLGGVARKTRESVLLCEAAGFDRILVETVGVGQSETAVKSLVDFFILLMLAGAGDELQGIKRGIMEMADLLLINKADREDPAHLRQAVGDYKRALHLFPPNTNEWVPSVESVSALEEEGIIEVADLLEQFENQQRDKGYLQANRQQQAVDWFRDSLQQELLRQFYENPAMKSEMLRLEDAVKGGEIDAFQAARELIEKAQNIPGS